eukprot:CAMPEP_0197523896 /NCGR_PEP_ID=MMETSP1318-20131121/8724_1 /TAXON_ID=552666 /ORGANISM="Partenskyella glossopodia, Strain RCC365" /LENGTH=312 /DNA_ID=CAMNT_0043076721 /DNA_START=84 /DNA_END=1022 /DNA_ORIENTATION=+
MQSAAQRLEAVQQLMLQQQGKTLVEFKAGKLKQMGTTVTADPRRGTLLIKESAADGLTRIQWKTRPGGNLEDDLVIIPNDATVEKVPECKTGRVILVRMRSAQKRMFFWMQEPEEKKDDEILDKIKKAFDESRSAADSMMGGLAGLGGAGGGAAANDMQAAIQQFLMQQRGAAAGGAPAAGNSANEMAVQQMRQMQATSLVGIVGQASLIMEGLDEKSKTALYEFLPEGQRNEEGLRACLHSPQLQQGAARLTRVLNSGQYGNLVTSFGLRNTGEIGCKAFLDAIKAKYGKDEPDESKKEESKEDDSKMETE